MILAPIKNVTYTVIATVDVRLNGRATFNNAPSYAQGFIGGYPSILYSADQFGSYRPSILQYTNNQTYNYTGYAASGFGQSTYLIGNTLYAIGPYNSGQWGIINMGVDPVTGIINSFNRNGFNNVSNCGGNGLDQFVMPYVSPNGTVIVSQHGMLAMSPAGAFTAPYSRANDINTYANRYSLTPSSNLYPMCQVDDTHIMTCSSTGIIYVYEVAQYADNGGGCAASSIGATYRLQYSFRLSDVVGAGLQSPSQFNGNGDGSGGYFIMCSTYSGGYQWWVIYVRWPYVYRMRAYSAPRSFVGFNSYIDSADGHVVMIQNFNNLSYAVIMRSSDKFDFDISLNMASPPRDPQPINTTNILSTRYSK